MNYYLQRRKIVVDREMKTIRTALLTMKVNCTSCPFAETQLIDFFVNKFYLNCIGRLSCLRLCCRVFVDARSLDFDPIDFDNGRMRILKTSTIGEKNFQCFFIFYMEHYHRYSLDFSELCLLPVVYGFFLHVMQIYANSMLESVDPLSGDFLTLDPEKNGISRQQRI